MPLPFKFFEREDQNYYHDVRIYIMGSDVTPWLTSDVNITYASNGGINTATFNLSNQRNAFVLTEENLLGNGSFRKTNPYSPYGEYSELAKYEIWTKKNGKDSNGNPRNLSHAVRTYGPYTGSDEIKGGVKDTKRNASEATSSVTQLYPFAPGSLVFHKFDHVRIFIRNPLSISDEWMVAFSGFIDTKPYTEDTVTGLSTVRVTCQDVRYAMQRMRTQVNPTASVANGNAAIFAGPKGVVKDSPSAGYFNDLIDRNFQINHVLATLSFKDTINFLLLGQPAPKANIESIDVGGNPQLNRVGEYTRGEEVRYKPGDKATLEKWNNLILFGQYSESPSFMTLSQVDIMGRTTHPWKEGEQFNSIWGRKVHYLFPAEGAPISNLIETSYKEGSVGTDKIQWASRLELMLDVLEKLDYVMYVTPIGDIVFEFPMWDFSPKDFGASYEEVYKFRKHVISRDVNDEGGDAVSGVIVSSDYLNAEIRGAGENASQSGQLSTANERTATIYSNVLASRIGVQLKTIYKPGIPNQTRLEEYGMIEFAKSVAEFNKYSFRSQYRPFIMVNRPIYDIDSYRIGTSNTVTCTWRLRDTVDMDIDLNYVRRGEIDKKTGDITFRFITGGESSPISYNKIYTDGGTTDDRSVPGIGGQGIGTARPDYKVEGGE